MMQGTKNLSWTERLTEQVRRNVSDLAVQSLFAGMTGIGALDGGASQPWARHQNLRHYRDIPFTSQCSELKLDVHRPDASGHFPALLHIHGGAFRMMSKTTHAHIADAYARGGFVVFNIDYRLGPEHTYPAPLQDVLSALGWIARNGSTWGADTDQIFIAGESAGANLAVSAALVTVAGAGQQFEVDLEGIEIGGIVSACGIHEVDKADRFKDGSALGAIVTSQLEDAKDGYLRGVSDAPWANPLRVLRTWREEGREVRLPPCMTFAGSDDPLQTDSERLAFLWDELGGVAEEKTYSGQGHSFHAFMWRETAHQAWADQQAFLEACKSASSDAEISLRLVG